MHLTHNLRSILAVLSNTQTHTHTHLYAHTHRGSIQGQGCLFFPSIPISGQNTQPPAPSLHTHTHTHRLIYSHKGSFSHTFICCLHLLFLQLLLRHTLSPCPLLFSSLVSQFVSDTNTSPQQQAEHTKHPYSFYYHFSTFIHT